MAPFRFLDLPEDLLGRVATALGHSACVVACSSRDPGTAAVRLALRAGVDEYERQRFPGATTIREAEAVLQVKLRLTHESRQRAVETHLGPGRNAENAEEVLASQLSAGREILVICHNTVFDPDAPAEEHLDLILPLLNFGGIPDFDDPTDDNVTALHFVAGAGFSRSPEIATLLISAGADVNARTSCTKDMSGRAPLAWAVTNFTDEFPDSNRWMRQVVYNYQCAIILLDAGADVRTANDDYVSNNRDTHSEDTDFLQNLSHVGQQLELPREDYPESVDLDLLRRVHAQVLDAVRAKLG